jgi:hypothetical protein
VDQVVAVRDAVAVGDDQRRPVECLGFEERLDRLRTLMICDPAEIASPADVGAGDMDTPRRRSATISL